MMTLNLTKMITGLLFLPALFFTNGEILVRAGYIIDLVLAFQFNVLQDDITLIFTWLVA